VQKFCASLRLASSLSSLRKSSCLLFTFVACMPEEDAGDAGGDWAEDALIQTTIGYLGP